MKNIKSNANIANEDIGEEREILAARFKAVEIQKKVQLIKDIENRRTSMRNYASFFYAQRNNTILNDPSQAQLVAKTTPKCN